MPRSRSASITRLRLPSRSEAREPLFRQDQGAEDMGRWLGLLTLYDVVFVLLSVAVFDFLLED